MPQSRNLAHCSIKQICYFTLFIDICSLLIIICFVYITSPLNLRFLWQLLSTVWFLVYCYFSTLDYFWSAHLAVQFVGRLWNFGYVTSVHQAFFKLLLKGKCLKKKIVSEHNNTINTFPSVFFFSKLTLNSTTVQLPFTTDFQKKVVV